MLSLEEISDRLELQHLLISYSEAIDRREFDELDAIFTPDAYIDYRVTGGIDGPYPQIKAWPDSFSIPLDIRRVPKTRLISPSASICTNPPTV